MLRGMPRPLADDDTQAFWDACSEGRLVTPRCAACGADRWPPGPRCPVCQGETTEWIESRGEGRVYSWTVVIHPVDAVLASQTPYVVALIDLADGPRILANIVMGDPAAIHAGMPVFLVFERQDGLNLPNFRPAQ